MRRQLAIAAAAISSMIVLAFVVPLGMLVRTLAEDRALANAERRAQAVVPSLASLDSPKALAELIERLPGSESSSLSVILADGTVVGAPTGVDDDVALARTGRAFNSDRPDGVAVLLPVTTAQGTDVVRVFVPDAERRVGVYPAWLLLGALGIGLVVVATFVADRFAKAIVGPVDDLARTAERLSHGDLDARAQVAGPPEIVEVGLTLNRLASRIGDLLTAERESVADLSHRLRTPITALRLDVDGIEDTEQRERLAGDVDSLTRAVDSLIAEARRPVRIGVGASSDLSVVTAERVAFWGVLADEQHRRYEISVDPGVEVAVPESDVAAVLDALLGNVFAHTPHGTSFRIRVTAAPPPGGGVLVVEDDGPGLPDHGVVDRGQSRAGSSGLGLDIIRSTAEASGGSLVLAPVTSTGGARLTVSFGPPAP